VNGAELEAGEIGKYFHMTLLRRCVLIALSLGRKLRKGTTFGVIDAMV
jgi:hypothetical protein